jgi:cobaltochelatase CobN
MHLLPTSEIRLDDGEDAVDLDLPPGDVLALSFADSDLSALAEAAGGSGLAVRLASLRRLRHPLSVDLLIEKTAARSRFVLVRCLGGLDYWRYGIETLAAACGRHGVALAVLPGDDRDDARLAEYGTVPAACAQALLSYFQAGGVENMRRLLGGIEAVLDAERPSPVFAGLPPPLPLPTLFALTADGAPLDWREALATLAANRALVPVLVYRSGVTAGDTAMAEALSAALATRGHAPLVLALTSLKDAAVTAELAALIATRTPALIVTTTAFSARDGDGFVLDAADCPILQAIPVGGAREAWEASPRGLSAVDLAMQVALPEFDGRIGAIPVAFKADIVDAATGLAIRRLVPDPDGVAALADLASGWIAVASKPVGERRLALVMSDYPARGGRAGFAVGLDTPASVAAIDALLAEAGYDVDPRHCERSEAIQRRLRCPGWRRRCAPRHDG